jgi:hypothetical protein
VRLKFCKFEKAKPDISRQANAFVSTDVLWRICLLGILFAAIECSALIFSFDSQFGILLFSVLYWIAALFFIVLPHVEGFFLNHPVQKFSGNKVIMSSIAAIVAALFQWGLAIVIHQWFSVFWACP